MVWNLPIVDIMENLLLFGEMEVVWVDVRKIAVMGSVMPGMPSALQNEGILSMAGSNARNCAMMNRNVILLRSVQVNGLGERFLIVIFTSRIHAKKMITNNQWELIIM